MFRFIRPVSWLRFTVFLECILVAAALAAAIAWTVSHKANQVVSFDYKSITPAEYRLKYGMKIFSYEEGNNQMAFMMSEDLVNTLIDRYLKEHGNQLEGYRVYEFVFRQKEGKFHMQVQNKFFRVPVQADASAEWDAATEEIVLKFSNAKMGETKTFWASFLEAPELKEMRIPVSYFELYFWEKVSSVELNTNEMLLYLQPDLEALRDWMQQMIVYDEVYLDWQNAISTCPQTIRNLYTAYHGKGLTSADASDLLKIIIDQQQNLVPVLAVMDEAFVRDFLATYRPYINEDLVNMEERERRRALILEQKDIAVAEELLRSFREYVDMGIGVTPPAWEPPDTGVDNSYVKFTDNSRLLGTAVIIQNDPVEIEIPEHTFYTDAGVIYDYQQMAFVTAEWLVQLKPLSIPHVESLSDYRFYYNNADGECVVLLVQPDTVQAIGEFNTWSLDAEAAERQFPLYRLTPQKAEVPDASSEVRSEIKSLLESIMDEGPIMTRYLSTDNRSAFVVFSTEDHMERIRTAVLRKVDNRWIVMDYDVMQYLIYSAEHPEINGTIFPLETIQGVTVRSIPKSGLNLLLEKMIQLNLADGSQTIDYYYYMDRYIYVHLTNGKSSVFQVSGNEVILACRSVESARRNWELPAFFVLEDAA